MTIAEHPPDGHGTVGAARLIYTTRRTGSTSYWDYRDARLGASEVAAVVGLSPWESPLSMFLRKRYDLGHRPGNKATEWGTRIEPLIRAKHLETLRATGEGSRVQRCGLLANIDHPERVATPDALVFGRHPVHGAEYKVAYDEEGWGPTGSDEIPPHYTIQCQWSMLVTGFQFWEAAALIGGQDYRQYLLAADPVTQQWLAGEASQFLADVATGNQPSYDDRDVTYVALRRRHPDITNDLEVELPEAVYLAYRDALVAAGVATSTAAIAKAELLDLIGGVSANYGVYEGERVLTRMGKKSGEAAPWLTSGTDLSRYVKRHVDQQLQRITPVIPTSTLPYETEQS